MTRHRRTALLAVCAAAALPLAGCASASTSTSAGAPANTPAAKAKGLADLTAQQIADRSSAAMKSATSLTVAEAGTSDGSPSTFRMSLDAKGDCAGEMGMDGGHIKLIKVGRTAYMKYDNAFWKSQGKDGAAAAQVIRGRWVKTTSADPDFKDMVSACDLKSILDAFESGATAATKGAVATVDGRPAVTLIEKDGAETNTAYVATEGKPYILKIVTKGGSEPGTTAFSNFDRPVNAKAPAAKDVTTLG